MFLPMPIRFNPPRAAALLAASLMAACAAPLQPVADFGAAADRLARDYEPFADGIGKACERRLRFKALGNAGPFDDAASERDARRQCGPLSKEAGTAALFAKALSAYATALAKLAGEKPTALEREAKAATGAVDQLEDRDGTPIFDKHKVDAASRLARAAAAIVLQEKVRRLERATLEDNRDALAVVVGAMKTYAGAIYAGQLRDSQDVMEGELRRLVAASDAPTQADVQARLPWRFAQAATRADIAAGELELRRVNAFSTAADALLAAHTALIDHFDRLDGAKRLALVADFVNLVEAVRGDAQAL
ncbi:MAG: hypothetical protein ABW032_05090 [Burkholderiaceae bacterium]